MPDGYAYAVFPLSRLPDVAEAAVPHKVLHVTRHAQGQHNEAMLKSGNPNEYKNEAWADSRLTELGKAQAKALRPSLEGVLVDVVLVSCLSRTIQTAELAFPPGPPTVCLDVLRERIGTHPCDRRRTKAELAADFPKVDFSDLASEADDKWTPEREPWEGVVARAEALCGLLRARKEESIALVTHNDFLQGLLLKSRLQPSDDSLRVQFSNAQCVPMVLAWRYLPR